MESERYEAPRTIAEVVSLLSNGADARVLAGGTDLLVQMRTGRAEPRVLVDVKHVPRLRSVELGEDGLWLGAAVSCAELREVEGLERIYPGLVEAAALIGSEQIQGRATLGGNLCNASPAADTAPALIALQAECEISGPDGERRLAVESFVTSPGHNALRRGELLVGLRIPRPEPRSADAYLRFIPRSEMDIAVVGAGVRLRLDEEGRCAEARVALGAVAPTPILAPEAATCLIGTALEEPALERAAAAARATCSPIDDLRGTADYRRSVAGVLVRRAARIAYERARERA